MKSLSLLTATFLALGLTRISHAQTAQDDAFVQGQRVQACLTAAASNARVPAGVLLVLLYVENGRPGIVSTNSNGTVDLGPMQVNSTWVRKVAAHWHSTPLRTYTALRDNVCANIEAGSWILGQALSETHGDLWQAVAYYHSHTPRYGEAYLRRFYHIATDMMVRARKGRAS